MEEIEAVISRMNEDSGALHKDIIDICFFMRGSINIDQAYQLTPMQRKLISKRIKKNFEHTEKSGMPLI